MFGIYLDLAFQFMTAVIPSWPSPVGMPVQSPELIILDMVLKFIIALAVVLSPVITIIVQKKFAEAAAKKVATELTKAADKVDQVKQDLKDTKEGSFNRLSRIEITDEKIKENTEQIQDIAEEIKKTGEDTHTLVNSNYAVALEVAMVATAQTAEIKQQKAEESPTEDNISRAQRATEEAKKAEKLYRDHMAAQNEVDKGNEVDKSPRGKR